MARVTAAQAPGDEFEGIRVADSDFNAAPAEGSSISAGEVEEVARAEIEEDGQFSSYRSVQLGGELDPTGNSAQGKLFIDLRDTNDNALDDRTEVRFVARPKNGNRRRPITEWYPLRDLARDDPRQRQPLPPATNEQGEPQLVGPGRILAVEVRNGATSVTVNLSNSVIDLPAIAGY